MGGNVLMCENSNCYCFWFIPKNNQQKMVKVGGGLVWCTGCYNSNYINQWGVGLSFLGGLVGKI